MNIRRHWLLLLVLALCCGLSQPAFAQQDQTEPIDVMLVVDDSGSMSDIWASGTRQPNDPEGLRHSAARLFIDLAREGDRLGVISFHTDPTGLGDVAEGRLTTVAGSGTKETLKSAIVQPTSPPSDERLTDIRKAMRLARDTLNANLVGNRQFIVFLTDGRPWPPDQVQELNGIIGELAADGVTIFPILLGNDVDRELAERMAEQTNGAVQAIESPRDLLQTYARVYGFIQPERYVDEVTLADGRIAAFRTSPDQGILNVNVILPKTPDAGSAFAELTRDGQSLLGQESLAGGGSITRSGDEHYEVVSIANNAPLSGEWIATTAGIADALGPGALIIADSVASLLLQYPAAEDMASTAAPRYYPAGKPVLLAAAVEEAGTRVSDLDLQAVLEGVQQPLQSAGLADDGSLYWTIVAPEGGDVPGQRTPVQLQIGDEVRPVRLLKEFTLVSGDFPQLVVDTPTERASGLEEDGRLALRAHFARPGAPDGEGQAVPEQASVVAYLADTTEGTVTAVELACGVDGVCQNRSFVPVEGRHYDVTFVANATADGTPYTDFAQGSLTMRDTIRLDSLPPILDFGRIPSYENSISRDVVLTALTSQDVDLNATLELEGAGADLPPGALSLSLSQPTHQAGNRYVSVLELTGFDSLPPAEYSGRIRFSSPGDVAVEPSAVALQFTIPTPEIGLVLPPSTDLGDLARPGEPREFTVQGDFSSGKPSEIEARLVELTSGGRPVDTGNFQVSVGSAQPVEAGARRFTVPVQLAATTRPRPGLYQGQVLFSSPEGLAVEPQRMQVTFNVPQPVTSILLPGDMLDFGPAPDLSRPISASLQLQQSILDQPPPLRVSLVELQHNQAPPGSAPELNVSAGAARLMADGSFRLPIRVTAVGEPLPGIYQGKLRLEAQDDVSVQPGEIDFIVQQLTPLEVLQYRLSPIATFFTNWFVPLPFLRWQGLIGWIVLLLVVNTLMRLRPGDNNMQGVVSLEETGKAASVRGQAPLYLVVSGTELQMSSKKKDRGRALALISFEQQVDSRGERLVWRPMVRPNPLAPEPVRVSCWQRGSNRWLLVKEEGKALWNGARFRLRLPESGARYHFRFAAE